MITGAAVGALSVGAGAAQAQFKQTNLVSDVSGLATITDPNLVNTWGVSNLPGEPFLDLKPGDGYNESLHRDRQHRRRGGEQLSRPRDELRSHPYGRRRPRPGPTGQVANSAMSSFDIGAAGPAAFIFANLNGTISAWNGSNVNVATKNAATIVATTPGALYTGLAINSAGDRLYAANGATGAIDVFDGSFAPTTAPGGFTDPSLPAGLVPFNVEDIGGKVYVTYAPTGHDAQTGAVAGRGAVAVFDESGDLLQNSSCRRAVNSPRRGAWPLRRQVSARSAATCWSAISASPTAKSTPSTRRQGRSRARSTSTLALARRQAVFGI